MRAIAYSMDTLTPGLYIWLGSLKVRIGGGDPEIAYPGTIHSRAGIALVLPDYKIWSTYQGDYHPDKHQLDGLGRITVKTLPDLSFEQLLLDAGYTKIGTAPA